MTLPDKSVDVVQTLVWASVWARHGYALERLTQLLNILVHWRARPRAGPVATLMPRAHMSTAAISTTSIDNTCCMHLHEE